MTDAARKSILMLGGSRQQVIALEKARALGYRTVLCDYLADNPGQYVADAFYLDSTTDRERMLEIGRAEGVEGVLAYASDPAAATASFVAESLGLPTNPLSAVEALSEKHRFRALLRSAGLPCPRSVSFAASDTLAGIQRVLGELRCPIVVKPTDSSGSKGVSVLRDLDGLEHAIEGATAHSRNGILIAEEYIASTAPHVIGGDIFVVDGIVRFWGLMSCLRDEHLGGLVPAGEFFPPLLSTQQRVAVQEVLQRLVTAAGIRFGELNVEVILGEGDVPYVLELGARAGGNMIPVQLSDASGIDLVAANVRCALGEDPGNLTPDWRPGCFATFVIHSSATGVFEGVSFDDDAAPFVYRTVMYLEPGQRVEPFDGANKAIGIAFLHFHDEDQMARTLHCIDEHVHIRVRPKGA